MKRFVFNGTSFAALLVLLFVGITVLAVKPLVPTPQGFTSTNPGAIFGSTGLVPMAWEPRHVSALFNDFNTFTLDTVGWTCTLSGTATTCLQSATNQTASNPGQLAMDCGTTTTGIVEFDALIGSSVGAFVMGTNPVIFETTLRLAALSSAAEEYNFYIGCADALGAGDLNDGFGFKYDRDGHGTTWYVWTENDGSGQYVDSTTTVAASAYVRLTAVMNAAATSIDFYINGTRTNTLTGATLPTGAADDCSPYIKIVKSAGTAVESRVDIDYLGMWMNITAGR